MGFASLSILASFTLLVAYSVLTSEAALIGNSMNPTQSAEQTQKRPASSVWLKSIPIRRLKPLNSYSLYRRELPEVEFIDDAMNNVEKRFDDDYGHMRFGKRGGGGEGDGFDDYGHMRFGR